MEAEVIFTWTKNRFAGGSKTNYLIRRSTKSLMVSDIGNAISIMSDGIHPPKMNL